MIAKMDRASQVLAQGLPPDVPETWATLSERSDVPLTTLYYREQSTTMDKPPGKNWARAFEGGEDPIFVCFPCPPLKGRFL